LPIAIQRLSCIKGGIIIFEFFHSRFERHGTIEGNAIINFDRDERGKAKEWKRNEEKVKENSARKNG